jgi:aminoglycoside 3-N-acetyltransferase
VRGGAEAVAAALTGICGTVVAPAFTTGTLVVPLTGPPNNGMRYAGGDPQAAERNALAEFWRPDLPGDREAGAVAEALRRHPEAWRSDHPVLSFSAVGRLAAEAINAQLLTEPLAPLNVLLANGGDLLLLGADLSAATIIHLAERRAGRRAFVRWALTTQMAPAHLPALSTRRLPDDGTHRAGAAIRRLLHRPPNGLETCVHAIPEFPGCSRGFVALAPQLAAIGRSARIGAATVWRYPLAGVVAAVAERIREDPEALLCDDPDCARCAAVRATLATA